MVFNITRNRLQDQRPEGLTRCNLVSNLGCTDRQSGHRQLPKTRFKKLWSGKSRLLIRPVTPISYTNYSGLHNLLPGVPAWQGARLVCAEQKKQFSTGLLALQFTQGIDRVARSCALGFARINHHFGQIGKGQPRHCQAMQRRAQGPRFVPGLTGGDDTQLIELQFSQRCLRQRHMRCVRRIKSAAKHGNAPGSVRARSDCHLRPSPDAPGTCCTTRLPENLLPARSGTTNSPAAASTAGLIPCARPTASQSACPGPRPN